MKYFKGKRTRFFTSLAMKQVILILQLPEPAQSYIG